MLRHTGDGDASPGPISSTAALPRGAAASLWARFRGWVVLLFLGIVWGLSFSLAKIAVGSGMHPLGVTFWQALIGALFLAALMLARLRPISTDRQMLKVYLACGVLGTVAPGTLFFYAAVHVSAGVLSITVAVVPILTFLASAIFGVERLVAMRILGVVCGAVAIFLLVGPSASLPDRAAVPWVLVALAAAACYAAENLYIAMRLPPNASALTASTGMFIAATLIMAPVVIATDSFVPLTWPFDTAEWAVISMSMISAVAYGLFVYLVAQAGPVFASQVAYVVTLSGVFWGMAIFDERHSYWIWLSLAVMIVGLALVSPRKSAES